MLAEAVAELRTARSVVSHWEQVVSGLQGLLHAAPLEQPVLAAAPVTPPPAPDEGSSEDEEREYLTTAEAVHLILRSRPNFPMPFPKIWHELQERGLIDPKLKAPRNSYGNAANRLTRDPDSRVVRNDDGTYEYRTAPDPQDSGDPMVTPQMASHGPLVLAGTGSAWQEASS